MYTAYLGGHKHISSFWLKVLDELSDMIIGL